MIPTLNKLSYDRSASISLEQVFKEDPEEMRENPTDHSSKGTAAPKLKRRKIETVRHDVLHEENLNSLVELV